LSAGKGGKFRRLLRWLPGLVISAIAIYAVVRFTRGQDFGAALRAVKPWFVVFLITFSILTLFARSIAWRTILGNRVNLMTCFFGVNEGYFLNNLFPLRAGELGRALFVGQSSGLGMMHILSTILIERAFDIFFAASILLLTLPLVVGAGWIKPVAFVAFILVIVGMVFLFILSLNRQKFQSWLQNRNIRSILINRYILPQVNKLLDGLSALVHPGQFFLGFLWIGLNWLLWLFMYYVTIAQLAPLAPIWWGGFIGSVLSLGVAIPAAPASIGVYEASVVGAFTILGVSSSAGLAYAVVLHLVQIVVTTTFGLWGMIRDGRSFSSLLASIREKQQVDQISTSKEF
jgi:uncharacterized protein (TIRG00374 family)